MKSRRIASISMAHIEDIGELEGKKSFRFGPFHFISTPPLWKRSIKIYPLRIKDQKCRHVPPHQKLPKFSFPLRKKAIFFQAPRKYLKDQRRRRSVPLRNDVQGPPQKISSIGGVWILNGMALFKSFFQFSSIVNYRFDCGFTL